ncbi:hypothetical protein XELAEV_18036472mg [Xenopus laevis]|uniref:Uncharacterized protein n=1 Tax=Xenopus laevis TaxID=8355 RepID=A0A974CHK4_XENLA|nr:hypothetical protein XELAEV_18036472mg [Xenopus laevis]
MEQDGDNKPKAHRLIVLILYREIIGPSYKTLPLVPTLLGIVYNSHTLRAQYGSKGPSGWRNVDFLVRLETLLMLSVCYF